MTSIYLAGGMRSGWQDKVIAACHHLDVKFYDPRAHGLTDEREYTLWDLNHAKDADYVFAYMGADNPSGLGMMLEIGYCIGAMGHTIFVEDAGDPRAKSYGMARVVSAENYVGFDVGIAALLRQLVKR